MRRLFASKVLIYLLLLIVLDITLAPALAMGDVRFFLSYLMVIYAAFQWGWKQSIPIALLLGVLRELAGSEVLGIETCAMMMGAFLLGLAVQKIDKGMVLLRLLTTLVFVFFVLTLRALFSVFLTEMKFDYWYYLSVSLGCSVYTAALTPLFFHFSARWFHDRTAIKQYDLFA